MHPTKSQDHPREALWRELVRSATLAASSHNSQPWRFRFERDGIGVFPDWARRCPAVDPDDHHLFTSLGCATENLLHAASVHGLSGDVEFDVANSAIDVRLSSWHISPSPLAGAIAERQCSRADYGGGSVPSTQLGDLENAARGAGVEVLLLTAPKQLEGIADFVAQGNDSQFSDRAWVEELKTWIRFNGREAKRMSDGLYVKCMGAPAVPRWVANSVFRYVVGAKSQNRLDVPRIRSSSGVAVFVSDVDDRRHWIEVGRSYERFALLATSLGIKNAFINQPVEVDALRPQLAQWLGLGTKRPDLLVRFGYGPAMPTSLRRPVDDVLERFEERSAF